MAQIINNKQSFTFSQPMVVLPLDDWQNIEDMLDDYECLVRYNEAINDPDNQKTIPFEEVKKKFNLP